jgi:hypothetical protein
MKKPEADQEIESFKKSESPCTYHAITVEKIELQIKEVLSSLEGQLAEETRLRCAIDMIETLCATAILRRISISEVASMRDEAIYRIKLQRPELFWPKYR